MISDEDSEEESEMDDRYEVESVMPDDDHLRNSLLSLMGHHEDKRV